MKYIIPILIFIGVMLAQIIITPLISFKQITPDFLTIFVVLFTLKNGQLKGTILGSVSGLLLDLFTGGIIGSAMFSKTVCGFIAGYFFQDAENGDLTVVKTTLIIFLCSMIDSFLFALLGVSEVVSLGNLLVSQSLLSGTFTMLLSLPILAFKLSRNLNE